MSKQAKKTVTRKEGTPTHTELLFGRENYLLMLASIVLIVIGFWLMSGSEDIFSATKITVAPILVLSGFVVGGVAIFFRKKVKDGDR